MVVRSILAFLIFAISAAFAARADVVPSLAKGQVWSIKSSSPSTAKVVIARIEPWKDKTVVHICIIDFPVSDTAATKITAIAHMPFEKAALVASLDRLLATHVAPVPDFERGYNIWKEKHGGIFKVSVAQAIHLED